MERKPGTPEWSVTLERVERATVSIHYSHTRAFDTGQQQTCEATGFVVDAKRGFPHSGEQVDVYTTYYHPVHDFGFLKFDPKHVLRGTLVELSLRPDLARLNLDIRIIGNDAGQTLSVLAGTISRLDRNAPQYDYGYRDWNTVYYQASASAVGGSSGSPVVEIGGNVVGIQVGGRADDASTDYFLPVDQPLRALQCLQEGRPITTGDIQCLFLLRPYSECRQRGLTEKKEEEMRQAFPTGSHLIVAERILPEGPAYGKIQISDILLRINDRLIGNFLQVEEILDDKVGQTILLLLLRGGTEVQVEIQVGDLYEITPNRFVSVSGGIFHTLSYQWAMRYGIACTGVLLCSNDGSFSGGCCCRLIETVNGEPIENLDSFIEVMQVIPDRARFGMTYRCLEDLNKVQRTSICLDRHYSPGMSLTVLNRSTGCWEGTEFAKPLPPVPIKRQQGMFKPISHIGEKLTNFGASFVLVECRYPFLIDGLPSQVTRGHGCVVNADKGLVAISRAVVCSNICDISVTIAQSIMVQATVDYLDPERNYAIIRYNPELVDAPVRTAKLSSDPVMPGMPTHFIGFRCADNRLVHFETTVANVSPVGIPANDNPPRYRAVNVDVVTVTADLAKQCSSGVLVNSDGTVQALWLTFLGPLSNNRVQKYRFGLPGQTMLPVITQLQNGLDPQVRMLPVELEPISLTDARIAGVPDNYILDMSARSAASDPSVLRVARQLSFIDGNQGGLQEGDILLEFNGDVITDMSGLGAARFKTDVEADVIRNGQKLTLNITTLVAKELETDNVICFGGATIQTPHLAVRQQSGKLFSEVYVSAKTRGSPCYQSDLFPVQFITHVNYNPTPNLEAFLVAVKEVADNSDVVIRVVSLQGIETVVVVRMNTVDFPTCRVTSSGASITINDAQKDGCLGKEL